MKKIIIASTRKSAGKTSLIVGLARSTGMKTGYIKPFGDRLLYRKKRLWDYDAALLTNVLGVNESAETCTIGFERSKLKYMYNEETTLQKLREIAAQAEEGNELLMVEAGSDMSHGVSVFLDPVTLASTLEGKLVVVLRGGEDTIMDDVAFLKKRVAFNGVELGGVVVNGVQDSEDFIDTYSTELAELGVPLLGTIPHEHRLQSLKVQLLAETLFARVVAGESGLDKEVKTIFVGAMSADAAIRNPLFNKEKKLIITSGDRSDMILASLNENTSAVVLANNILPPSNVTNRATQLGIPLLLVSMDTFRAAKQVHDMEPLLTAGDDKKVDALEEIVKKHVDIEALLA